MMFYNYFYYYRIYDIFYFLRRVYHDTSISPGNTIVSPQYSFNQIHSTIIINMIYFFYNVTFYVVSATTRQFISKNKLQKLL